MRELTFAALLCAAPASAAPALDSARAVLAAGADHTYDGAAASGAAVSISGPTTDASRLAKPDASRTPILRASPAARGLAGKRAKRAHFLKKRNQDKSLDVDDAVGAAALGAIVGALAGVILFHSAAAFLAGGAIGALLALTVGLLFARK